MEANRDYDDEESLIGKPKLLPIQTPVGSYGDTLLELQVRYANNANVRQRIVADATKPPAGNRKHSNAFQKKNECARNFQQFASQAVAHGDGDLAIQALEQLARMEQSSFGSNSNDGSSDDQNPVFFSLASEYAKIALARLETKASNSNNRCAQMEQELLKKMKRRAFFLKLMIPLPLLSMVAVYISDQYQDNDPPHDEIKLHRSALFCTLYSFIIFLGYQSLVQRNIESKQLVQELFLIASNEGN